MQCGLRPRAQSQASVCGHPGPVTESILYSTVCPFRSSLSGLCKAEKSSSWLWSPFQPGLDGSTFCGRQPVRYAAPLYPLPTCRLESPTDCSHLSAPWPRYLQAVWVSTERCGPTQCSSPPLHLLPRTNLMFFFKFCVCEIKQTHGNGT